MQLETWNPFREMDDLLRRHHREGFPSAGTGMEWAPVVDIKETKKEYLIEAELPGVGKEDINVTYNDGVLTLSGERREEKESDEEKQHRVERFYGNFTRSFSLPDNVDADGISAENKNGLIRIHLPKTEVTPRRSVEIKVD